MIYFPFIYFSLLLLYTFRKKRITLASFVLLVYVVSSFMSIILYFTPFLRYQYINITLKATLYYCSMLTLFLFPFLKYPNLRIEKKLIRKNAILEIIIFILAMLNMVGIVLTSRYTYFVLTHSAGSFKQGGIRYLQSLGFNPSSIDLLGKQLFGYFSDFYIFIIIGFFFSYALYNRNKYYNLFLLGSSLGTILNGIQTGGRTQLVYWVFIFTSSFIYFKPYLSKRKLSQIKKYSLIIGIILSLYFISTTIYRFSNIYSSATRYQTFFSMIEYGGMSFISFNDFFENFHRSEITLARIFPVIHDILSVDKFNLIEYRNTLSMNIGIFYTFLGDLYVDISIVGTFIYLIVYLTMYKLTQPASKTIYSVIIYFTLFQIPLNGIFFYSLWNKTAAIAFSGTFILILLSYIPTKSH